MPARSGDVLWILSRARSEDWRDGSLMSGGWLVAVGHEWWGRGERVGAPGGFSPPCPTAPVGTGVVGRWLISPCLPFFALPFPASRGVGVGVFGPSQAPPLEAVNILSPPSLLLEIAVLTLFFPLLLDTNECWKNSVLGAHSVSSACAQSPLQKL